MDRIDKLEIKVDNLEIKVDNYINDTNKIIRDLNDTLVQLLKATLEFNNLVNRLEKAIDKMNERFKEDE